MPYLTPATADHPRIHFTGEDLDDLRRRCRDTHEFYYGELLRFADDFAETRMPSNFGRSDADRIYGDMVPVLAMAWLISLEDKYLKSCVTIIEALLSLERWGDGLNLVTGHYTWGIATAYDWLYGDMDAELRARMAHRLGEHAQHIFEYASDERIWWHDMFLHNWSHVIIGSLGSAAAALHGEDERAQAWIDFADGYFTKVVEALPDEGSYQEGQAYLTYALEYILRYMDLARQCFGRDHFGCKWLSQVPYFLVYFSTPHPRPLDNCMVFGDGLRHFEWHGPVHLFFRIAAEYVDSQLQGFAAGLPGRGVGITRMGAWANILWYDPAVAAEPLDELPTARFFKEIDSVSMRSAWDEDAVLVGFKCSNNMLRKTTAEYPGRDLGSGHSQPDAAGFQVYAFGEWLAIHPGYTNWKRSEDHNTFLINGVGQLGGDRTWFDVLESQVDPCEITSFTTTDIFDYARADASGIYRPAARLERFIRHLVFIKPHDILIVDELEAAVKSRFEWRLHTEDEILTIGREHHIRKNDARARILFLAPDDLAVKVSTHRVVGASHTTPRRTVMLSAQPEKKARKTFFATLLSVYRGGEPGSVVDSLLVHDGVLHLRLLGEHVTPSVSLDLASATVEVV